MTTDTTKAPHCPRCGWQLVHQHPQGKWYVRCDGCDFHSADDADAPAYGDGADARAAARLLVRAELAKQALEMRAHSAAQAMNHTQNSVYTLDDNMQCVMKDYIWRGTHPLRLPGEEA